MIWSAAARYSATPLSFPIDSTTSQSGVAEYLAAALQIKWIRGRFNWQEGFGAFSYSHSHLDSVIRYIRNQERHHAKRSFRNEYLTLLKRFDIAYEPKYLFEFFTDE
jgi:hypothetical protein